jgi:hypothetical protein
MAFNLFEAPEYYQGLLGEDATKKLQNRALTTGLVNAAIGYLAQPKTGGYGSALPYLGRALAGGLQAGQETIKSGLTDYETQQKIAEMQRQRKAREAFDTASQNLYTTTPAQFETVSTPGGYAPQQTGIMSNQVSPNFGMTRLPDVTTQRQTAPAKKELNQEALMQLALSGDPRAKTYVDTLVAMKDLNPQAKPRPTQIAPNGQLIYTDTGEPVTQQSFAAPEKGTSKQQDYAFYVKQETDAGRAPKSFNQWDLQSESAKAPKSFVNLSDPTAKARAGIDLSERAAKFYQQDVDTANQFQVITDLAKKNPNATGDTTLLYTYFKVLDPTSTVREGEIQMVKDSRSIPDKFKAYAQRLAGGGSLNQTERNEIYRQAEMKVQSRKKQVDKTRKAWVDNAKRLELDPNLYVPDPYGETRAGGKVEVDY